VLELARSMSRRTPSLRALPLVLPLVVGAGARAGTVKGQVIFPPPSREAPQNAAPLSYWRVENGLIPPAPQADVRGDVLVVLEPLRRAQGDPPPITISVKPLRFEPRIVTARPGAILTFKNDDKQQHSLYLKNGDLFMPRQVTPPGGTREVKFTELGEYRIADADDAHASVMVLLVDGPYSARPDDKGGFAVEAPDGSYTLRAWWRGGWSDGQPVEVGRTKDVVLKLPAEKPAPPTSAGQGSAKGQTENK
jgi:hypothetical protein